MIFDYLVYILFGLIPSFLWLYFYLKKDSHPEPKLKILEVFCGGILVAIIAAIVESLVLKKVVTFAFPSSFFRLISIFIIIALIEETLKYLVVRLLVLNDSEFDEPIDLFVYLIVSALGFAALENTFLFFSENMQILETIIISSLRFVGATLLHALSSAIVGYYWARGIILSRRLKPEKEPPCHLDGAPPKIMVLKGLILATLLHAAFNYFILISEEVLIYPTIFLIIAALFVFWDFEKIKNG